MLKNTRYLFISVAPLALACNAMAQEPRELPQQVTASVQGKTVTPAPTKAPAEEAFTTGVAKGRDRLDSATSTSALKAVETEKAGPRSLGEALGNIPGIRAEYAGGEGTTSFSIRGLPMLEFGDVLSFTPDAFMRFDLNVAQVEAIRGGSSSTFASNSPGGVINLLSKTGDIEGSAIQTTLGINSGAIPASGIVLARAYTVRTISATARYSF